VLYQPLPTQNLPVSIEKDLTVNPFLTSSIHPLFYFFGYPPVPHDLACIRLYQGCAAQELFPLSSPSAHLPASTRLNFFPRNWVYSNSSLPTGSSFFLLKIFDSPPLTTPSDLVQTFNIRGILAIFFSYPLLLFNLSFPSS